MSRHLVVGAGPVGREVASVLVDQGHEVTLASRSGAGQEITGAQRVALDATDPGALTAAAQGAAVTYNCINPPHYHRWASEWPPMAEALLQAAAATGAVLATVSNLYPYGPVDAPMVEGMPDAATETKGKVRGQLTAQALQAHRDERVRYVEVRASDYMGRVTGAGAHIPRVVPAALAGKTVRVMGAVDQPHTWTDVRDVARAIVRVAAEPQAHGRVWHAPSNPPRTQTEAVADVCAAAGRSATQVKAFPSWALASLGLVMPVLREIRDIDHQFTRPFVMDSSAITEAFDIQPTPWAEVCARTAAAAGVGDFETTGPL